MVSVGHFIFGHRDLTKGSALPPSLFTEQKEGYTFMYIPLFVLQQYYINIFYFFLRLHLIYQ